MPSFLAAVVTLPLVAASACMINFFSVSCRSILCNDERCLDYAWYDKSGDLIFVRLFT
jgi:hypothetical protein